MEDLSHDCWSRRRDLNPRPHKYKGEVLLNRMQNSVWYYRSQLFDLQTSFYATEENRTLVWAIRQHFARGLRMYRQTSHFINQ
jgi:hypothetical protein